MAENKQWGIVYTTNKPWLPQTLHYQGTAEQVLEYYTNKLSKSVNLIEIYEKIEYDVTTVEEYVLADENQVYHYWQNVVADPPQIYVKDSSDKFVAVKFMEYFCEEEVYVTAIVDSNGDALLIYSKQLDPDDKEFYVKKTETKLVEKK